MSLLTTYPINPKEMRSANCNKSDTLHGYSYAPKRKSAHDRKPLPFLLSPLPAAQTIFYINWRIPIEIHTKMCYIALAVGCRISG